MNFPILLNSNSTDFQRRFVGVVENRNDPAQLGRVQVRIIGIHDSNLNLLPTKDLPWAQVVIPIGGFSFATPKNGDWVDGYFQDSDPMKQLPIITGIHPGIAVKPPVLPNTTAKPQRGFQDQRSQAQKDADPKPPEGVTGDRPGEPTTPPTSRGDINGTQIEKSNIDRVGECDFAIGVQHTISGIRFVVTTLAAGIRDGIKALLAALGIVPSVGGLADLVKSLANMIRRISDIIEAVNDGLNAVVTFVQKIRAVIDYILNLPAQLIAMFQKCLQQAYAELATGFTDAISGLTVTGTSSPELSASMKELQASYGDLKSQTAQLIAKPGQIIGALVNPSTMTAEEKAKLIKDLYPDSIHEQPTKPKLI